MSIENGPERNNDFLDPRGVVEEVRQHPERWEMGLGNLNPQRARMRRIIEDTRRRLAELEAEGRKEEADTFREYLENFLTREREFSEAIEEIRRIGEDYERKK